MNNEMRGIIERKVGFKFITKEEKDKLREEVMAYSFTEGKKVTNSKRPTNEGKDPTDV